MASNISDISYSAGNKAISWVYNMQPVERLFANPVKAVPLKSDTGLLVIEPASSDAPDTAVILNGDGSLRTRVRNPEARDGAICFGDAYYVKDELTLIICFSSWQMACVIDEEGHVVRTYETR
jgi:hypothetical protein